MEFGKCFVTMSYCIYNCHSKGNCRYYTRHKEIDILFLFAINLTVSYKRNVQLAQTDESLLMCWVRMAARDVFWLCVCSWM